MPEPPADQNRTFPGSLEPVRDMTFVYDTVEGFIEIGLCDEAIGKVVNLGTGIGKSVGEIVEIILKITNRVGMPIVQDADRIRPEKSEVMRLISDNSLAKKITGWQPKYDLIQGLTITTDWIEKNLHRYRSDVYTV